MDIKTASELIEENLHTIYSWSFSKLYDKSEAEDLAQDIIYAVLKSVQRLEKDEAFFGYLWRTAENLLQARIRSRNRYTTVSEDECQGACYVTPEDEIIKSEELNLLRRELSILSDRYREVTVAYYIHGKSCSEISKELQISNEMVKYYLFKTRKILKEGISMNRQFGEKSYDPQVFRLGFWGGYSTPYFDLFKRRLPGNIVLSAYNAPVSVSELSVELGVSAVYLEDEIEILERYELLKKVGNKYQTNIIIFTDAYEKRVIEKFKPLYEKSAEIVNAILTEKMPELKKLSFSNNGYDENCLRWLFANIVTYHALRKNDNEGIERFGDYPPLANGSCGFVFGYDNDYVNHHFNGIYSQSYNNDGTAWVSVTNYRIIEKCQHLKHRDMYKQILALTDAVLNNIADEGNEEIINLIEEGFIKAEQGRLVPNFAVFGSDAFEKARDILMPAIEEVSRCMREICDVAAETLKDYVPKALTDKCAQLSAIHHQMDVMAYIIEEMVRREHLVIPAEKANVCMFGVDER